MADGHLETEHGSGIFIPYDKLLAQQSDKMDEILREVRGLSNNKVDNNVFAAFRESYDTRHEVVLQGVREAQIARERWVPVVQQHEDDIDMLKTDKAERDAVRKQNRFYVGGIILLVVANLVVNTWQVVTGQLPG